MLRPLITAIGGKKVAQKLGGGALGTAAVTAIPFIAKRGLGPLGFALTGLWAVKKIRDKRREKEARTYPPEATPTVPPGA